jgi:hypothetical protein
VGIAIKRSAARSRLLVLTAAVVALVAFLVTMMAGLFGAQETDVLRGQLAAGPAT